MSKFFEALKQADWDREEKARRDGASSDRSAVSIGPNGDEPLVAGALDPSDTEPRPSSGESRHWWNGDPGEARAPVDGHHVSLLHPASFLAESYRGLRHKLEELHQSNQLSIVAVSSPGTQEGKTTTAVNLAGALAQAAEARVLLIDADLRKSSIAAQLGLGESGHRGLVGAILDPGLALERVIIPQPRFNLDVLPAGGPPDLPYEVFKSARLGELLAEARRRYDHVIVDTAPLLPVPDTRLILKVVDGVLLVIGAHRTSRAQLAEALTLLSPTSLIGLVFNQDDGVPTGYYGEDRSPNGSRAQGRGF